MQEKTINNALLALRKQGGAEGKLAEVLLDMRGINWSGWTQDGPLGRGQTKRFILETLKDGPQPNADLGRMIHATHSHMTAKAAANRTYQALLRLEDKGLVVRDAGPDGCLWRLA
ncbi:hypothetical protein [Yoonia sp. 208BN28-4]|uniref:hypothetical protein n=1 Tax=Yoonia sp. 208BN28-4 TaxID=3126505 RepID=UPI0030A38CCB